MIHVLEGIELSEFIKLIGCKQEEIQNKNLVGCKEKKIEIICELFQLYLSDKGKLLLRMARNERLRKLLLDKIHEISKDEYSQKNMEYIECANTLKMLVENIIQGCLLKEQE
jgi:hypothetical protein